jgi:hypothetical protein
MSWILQQVRTTTAHFEAGRRIQALETYLDMITSLESDFLTASNADME